MIRSKKLTLLNTATKTNLISTNGSFYFDTSPDEDESKFVVNSPNIYLGLEFDDTLPTQPAVLGDRTDRLAHNYYGDRFLWWVINRANPDKVKRWSYFYLIVYKKNLIL